jgi:hypothetical protein
VDTESSISIFSSLPAPQLRREIESYTATAQRCLTQLQAAIGQEAANQAPHYRETAADARRYQEDLADSLLIDLHQVVLRLQTRFDGPGSIGLSSAEWQQAGTLTPLAQSRLGNAPLATAVVELRAALDAGDRPRLAAFVSAAEDRLAQLKSAPPANTDRVLWNQDDAKHELTSLIAAAKTELRDKTLDSARMAFKVLVGTRGDLSGAVFRSRQSRKPFLTGDGRPKVPWPVAEA